MCDDGALLFITFPIAFPLQPQHKKLRKRGAAAATKLVTFNFPNKKLSTNWKKAKKNGCGRSGTNCWEERGHFPAANWSIDRGWCIIIHGSNWSIYSSSSSRCLLCMTKKMFAKNFFSSLYDLFLFGYYYDWFITKLGKKPNKQINIIVLLVRFPFKYFPFFFW